MSFSLQLRGITSRLLSRTNAAITTTPITLPITPATRSTTMISPTTTILNQQHKSSFSTTCATAGHGQGVKLKPKPVVARQPRKGTKGAPARDPKLVNMLHHFGTLNPRRIPPPLRMARNRHLRHWTIHRAWLMFRRKQRGAREKTLMRQFQSMSAACEELRLTEGPGTRDQGYLYRVAMEKKGVYGHHGIPIEYARPQTETPARTPWNHDWKP
ncbi:hypothetical protein B0H66DRAFT_602837 [Apodospora peruviana]|uniref:Uncharacterized protein n=1 Tax=Apodospora peruviana TaxID=516989 RepID=A0AAE0M3V5_9PEZI|nr:hypothetical protein B0H66DRAFT_602837 [Apodospora peruviana]